MDSQDQIENETNELLYEQNRVEKIKRYISDNLATDLSITTVSKKFDLSISSLQHIFKSDQRQTYQHYLEDTRMGKAFTLVMEGERIKEVMHATGYKYRTTFNKAFKKRFKHPPGYFRK